MKHSDIERVVCEYFQLDANDLYLKTRKQYICYPRQVIMYFCIVIGKMTTIKSSSFYGLRHCSAVHAKKVCENYIETNKYKRVELKEIEEILLEMKSTPDIVIQSLDLLQLTKNYTNSILKVG